MALTISQMVASSYNAVLAAAKKPENQWAENSAMKELESQGCIKTIPGGPQIEVPLDYRRNQGGAFLVNDLDPMAMGKTDVLTAAVYDPAQLSVPVVWSKGDDAKNPEENQKVDFTKALLLNSFETHDELIEQALFSTVTNGFLGFQNLISDAGTGTIGGINSTSDAFWRNIASTFALSGVDLIAKLTLVWNQASKGSGSAFAPNFYITDATNHATFEGTQVGLQRYVGNDAFDAGRKQIAFKQGKVIFSQFATARFYGLNSKTYKLLFYKGAKRQKGDIQEIDNGNGYRFFIYTMLQAVTSARSRVFVIKGV